MWKMKILIASSRPERQETLVSALSSWGYRNQVVDNGLEALNSLQSGEAAPVIAVIDYSLPGLSGEDIVRRLRQRVDAPYQFLILVGDGAEREEMLYALSAGADVFLRDASDLVEMRIQLQVGQRIMERQLRQLILQESLWNQANRDALTSLPNRRAILKSLERNAAACAQRGQPLGLLMIDLDFFKQINDTFGHDGGDAVLREVAERMNKSVRNTDMVGRFGGEEFMAVIPNSAGEELLRIAERIRSAVNKTPISSGSQLIPVSCSIGVAVRWSENDGEPAETLQRSDRALYVAKEMGRNKVVSAWSLHDRSQRAG
jgi:two-component system, cell cycle response regulator